MNLNERLKTLESEQKDHRQRLAYLEILLARVLEAQENTEKELNLLSREMRAFKDEMRAFKDEMRAFKDEMRAFKDEMQAFKDEVRRSLDELNKKWGALANKMGTLAEDIIAPGIPYALRRTFSLEVKDLSIRHRRKLNGEEQEFDVIVVANGLVFLVDVKSNYRPQYLEDFAYLLQKFRRFFPEHRDRKLVGIISAFNFPPEIINAASKRGWLALQMGGEYLEFLNPEAAPFGQKE